MGSDYHGGIRVFYHIPPKEHWFGQSTGKRDFGSPGVQQRSSSTSRCKGGSTFTNQ